MLALALVAQCSFFSSLLLYEVYDDEAAFQQHVNSAHFKHFSDVSGPIITSRAGTRGTMFVTYHRQ